MAKAGPPPDYYAALGLARGATGAEIKAAYRRLARRHRPDLVVSPEWHKVAAAYKVLGDKHRRALYDQGQDTYARRPQHQARAEAAAASVSAALGLDQPPAPPRGTDVVVYVTSPGRHHVRYRRYAACRECQASGLTEGGDWLTCRRCRGRGEELRRRLVWLGGMSLGWVRGWMVCELCSGRGILIPAACERCQGSGRVIGDARVQVYMPPGRRWMRVRGGGNAGVRGGAGGDLWVMIGAAAAGGEAARQGRAWAGSVRRTVAGAWRSLLAYAREFRP